MLSETDKYLADAVRAGDYNAFETLYKSYHRYLLGVARLYVSSDEIAEDLVQDLFVKLWEQPSLLTANISLRGFLYRSIHNSCINYILRKQSKYSSLDLTTREKLKELLKANPEDQPETKFMTAEMDSAIKKAIKDLPPECCKIFLLSREEELSYKEIAQKLNISENTVKVQIYKALCRLRELLTDFL
jgi:RNA polymerase sigma-70 factor (ECF subfamily)